MALFLALLAAGGGYFAWLKYPSEFFSSSLLSYEDPGQFLSGQSATQPGTIAIADAVFSDEQLTRLATAIHYQPEGPAADDDPGMSVAQDLRSHLDFEQPAAGLLEVIVRGKDQGQVQRTANALVALLTEWKPAQGTEVATASSSAVPRNASVPAAAKQPVTVARIQLQLRVLGENYATLKLQKQSTEQQIKQLSARQLALESGTPDGGTSSLASTVKELGRLRLLDVSLSTEMARIRAQYGPLRDRIAQLRSQEGENGAPVAQTAEAGVDTELTAASPGAPPVASHADQAGGQFTVLEPPTASRPLNDGLRRWAPWAGGAAAGLLGLAYFLWMAWRYRAVEDAASTRRYLPADAPYYGAIIGKPLAGGSR